MLLNPRFFFSGDDCQYYNTVSIYFFLYLTGHNHSLFVRHNAPLQADAILFGFSSVPFPICPIMARPSGQLWKCERYSSSKVVYVVNILRIIKIDCLCENMKYTRQLNYVYIAINRRGIIIFLTRFYFLHKYL